MGTIEVRGLTKRYGPVLAVDRLSFSVSSGMVTGFLGPNGAGKTTTLRMLLGLVRPDAGTATINGMAYRDLPEPLHQVGAVLDAPGFHPGRTAGGGTMTRYAAGAAGGAALMAAAGAGLGSLIRSQLAAVIGVFAWAAVAEAVIGPLLPSVRPYLPYTAAATLAGTRLGGASSGAGLHVAGPGPLPFAAAAGLVAGAAVLLAAAASRTTVPRDIT